MRELTGWRPRERSALYDRLSNVNVLTEAWKAVRRGGGSGVDKQTIRAFEARWDENMAEVALELRERRYHPRRLLPFTIDRPDGGQRRLSILTVRDRLVQRAVLDVVRPVFEAAASPAAFGALPRRGVGAALARAEQARRDGNSWIVRSDIRAFFDEVDHRRLLEAFRDVVRDDALVALVAEWLEVGELDSPEAASEPADEERAEQHTAPPWFRRLRTGYERVRAFDEDLPQGELLRPLAGAVVGRVGADLIRAKRVRSGSTLAVAGIAAAAVGVTAVLLGQLLPAAPVGEGRRGTPQGSPLSPLLATSMLRPLDRAIDRPDRVLIRYIDDILIVCRDEAPARAALEELRKQVGQLGLALNETKTFVQPYDAGFVFLGAALPHLPGDRGLPGTAQALAHAFGTTGYWRARELMDRAARHRRPAAAPHGGKG